MRAQFEVAAELVPEVLDHIAAGAFGESVTFRTVWETNDDHFRIVVVDGAPVEGHCSPLMHRDDDGVVTLKCWVAP